MVCLTNLFLSMNFYLLMVIFSEDAMKKFDAPQSFAGLTSSMFVIGVLVTILKMFLSDYQKGSSYTPLIIKTYFYCKTRSDTCTKVSLSTP
jgi:hypothetical protein